MSYKFGKSKKNRQLRKRLDDDEDEVRGQDSEDEEVDLAKLQETRELQKLRKRAVGVSHVTLAIGRKVTKVEEELNVVDPSDPFKLKTGGLLDLKSAKAAKALQNGEDDLSDVNRKHQDDQVVGTQFSKETRVRDEDEEMRKFIEAEMEKRRGGSSSTKQEEANKYMSPEEKALQTLPEHLRKSTFRRNEEMLSSQMLSGIPEVDLGIEEKIRNIEATEEAKKKLTADQDRKRKKADEVFVAANLAVDFKRPDRFKQEELETTNQERTKKVRVDYEEPVLTRRTVVVGEAPEERVIPVGGSGADSAAPMLDKATDDLHLSKFKQHFQRK